MSREGSRLDELRRALAKRAPQTVELEGTPARAAVAVLFVPRGDDLELLLIERARRVGDPWSGQMAFPGGFHEPEDADLDATARREVAEEIGIDLGAVTTPLGRLDDIQAMARGRKLALVISPFLYAVTGPVEPRPNHEVASVVWVPLSFLTTSANVGTMDWEVEGEKHQLPTYLYDRHNIWGLTFRMIQNLVEVWKER